MRFLSYNASSVVKDYDLMFLTSNMATELIRLKFPFDKLYDIKDSLKALTPDNIGQIMALQKAVCELFNVRFNLNEYLPTRKEEGVSKLDIDIALIENYVKDADKASLISMLADPMIRFYALDKPNGKVIVLHTGADDLGIGMIQSKSCTLPNAVLEVIYNSFAYHKLHFQRRILPKHNEITLTNVLSAM